MTTTELVEHIADACNQTSVEAKARIARELNLRYRQVTTAIGLMPTRREELNKNATIGNRLITFAGAEKLDMVFRKVGTKIVKLDELTVDEMADVTPGAEPASQYSVFSMTQTTVTLMLDCIPTTTFTLYAYGTGDATTLSGNSAPAFPESFHDILIHGVLADEYRRKEKADLLQEAQRMYDQRLSDLKLFIAKSGYLEIYTGKHAPAEAWWDMAGN